jgi:hypothetical protein
MPPLSPQRHERTTDDVADRLVDRIEQVIRVQVAGVTAANRQRRYGDLRPAQLLPRLADQIDTDAGPALTGLPERERHRMIRTLKTAGGATRDGGWRRPLLLGRPGLVAGGQCQRSRTTRDLLLLP